MIQLRSRNPAVNLILAGSNLIQATHFTDRFGFVGFSFTLTFPGALTMCILDQVAPTLVWGEELALQMGLPRGVNVTMGTREIVAKTTKIEKWVYCRMCCGE